MQETKKPSVLVLDDEPANLDVVRTILENEGYDILCFRRAALALQAVENAPVDLFLLDIKMPEMDGFEVCAQLKANDRLKDIPVIFITATTETFDKVKGFGVGAADFITKPFDARELTARVDTHVRLYRTQLELEERVRQRTMALQASESRMRQIFEHSPVALFEEDFSKVKAYLDGIRDEGVTDISAYLKQHPDAIVECAQLVEILDSNKAALELHGAQSKAELHKNLTDTFVAKSFNSFKVELIAVWNKHQQLEVDSIVKTLNGEPRDVIIGWSVLPEYAENYKKVLVSISDITDRKRTELQLRQAQKMEAVGQLTGGIAHDFNNVLAVILGNLELTERELDPESKAGKFMALATKAAKRGASLTHRLLAFARKQPLETKAVDLRELVNGMHGMLHRSLGETIDLEVVQSAGLWTCDVDPSELEHALINLAINARDAMPNGGKLTIETMNASIDDYYAASHEEVSPGQYAMLTVSDTGSGIPSEEVNRIFEPFYTTKEIGKGTGLGLSMVYGFVKQSKGHIAVYSEEGQGTTFKLYFPRSATAQAEASHPSTSDMPTAASGEIILVVEDDEDVREMALEMLKALGYEVLAAENSAVALDVLSEASRIDLLLSDVVLPGEMRGPELAKEACRKYPDLKVLYMSGYSDNAIIHHGRLDPGVELLQKPFSQAELAVKLRKILDSSTESD